MNQNLEQVEKLYVNLNKYNFKSGQMMKIDNSEELVNI